MKHQLETGFAIHAYIVRGYYQLNEMLMGCQWVGWRVEGELCVTCLLVLLPGREGSSRTGWPGWHPGPGGTARSSRSCRPPWRGWRQGGSSSLLHRVTLGRNWAMCPIATTLLPPHRVGCAAGRNMRIFYGACNPARSAASDLGSSRQTGLSVLCQPNRLLKSS